MQKLNFPEFDFRLRQNGGKDQIFDDVRKKWLQLTPEEWVRQHFVKFLLQKNYPKGCLSIEKKVMDNRKIDQRTDLVAYDHAMQPFLLIECKAPSVKITQAVFEQAARYNTFLKAPFLAVSNGLQHFICEIDQQNQQYSFLKSLPEYVAGK